MSTIADSRPRVIVISLGGTIASTGGASAAGVVPQLTAADLTAAVPTLSEVARIETVAFRQVPSGDLTLADLVDLARLIRERISSGVEGVVVTQGTDTIEESAFALDLLIDSPVPVVVTGAMRNPTLSSPDGPANVLAAVTVAASPLARSLGCVVVFNDEIHAARFVRKTHASSLATFQSPNAGALGWLSEGDVHLATRPAPLTRVPLASVGSVPAVAIVACALGDDGRIISSLTSLGYGAAILDAVGGGHVAATLVEPITAALREIPFVLCSRTGAGAALSRTYGFVGSETDLLGRGVISGGALDARKARIAMSVALAASDSPAQAATTFAKVRDSVTESASRPD